MTSVLKTSSTLLDRHSILPDLQERSSCTPPTRESTDEAKTFLTLIVTAKNLCFTPSVPTYLYIPTVPIHRIIHHSLPHSIPFLNYTVLSVNQFLFLSPSPSPRETNPRLDSTPPPSVSRQGPAVVNHVPPTNLPTSTCTVRILHSTYLLLDWKLDPIQPAQPALESSRSSSPHDLLQTAPEHTRFLHRQPSKTVLFSRIQIADDYEFVLVPYHRVAYSSKRASYGDRLSKSPELEPSSNSRISSPAAGRSVALLH